MSEIFVTCASGFEPLLIEELKQLGIPTLRKGFRGVYVPKKMEVVYLVNYCSRLATRVLWPLAQFSCPDREALYQAVKKIDWTRIAEQMAADKRRLEAAVRGDQKARNESTFLHPRSVPDLGNL